RDLGVVGGVLMDGSGFGDGVAVAVIRGAGIGAVAREGGVVVAFGMLGAAANGGPGSGDGDGGGVEVVVAALAAVGMRIARDLAALDGTRIAAVSGAGERRVSGAGREAESGLQLPFVVRSPVGEGD